MNSMKESRENFDKPKTNKINLENNFKISVNKNKRILEHLTKFS
jgi:hypothetical protein